MKTQGMTLEQIRLTGLEVLARELGPVRMVRFLQQFETGTGDYSVDRHRWLGEREVHGVAEEIRQYRQRRKLP
ncbi:MAG: hypothetical protein L6435_15190 [Anaerolineae bacterium]|nr:hypothetical protein [Anaerolineae bacterium]